MARRKPKTNMIESVMSAATADIQQPTFNDLHPSGSAEETIKVEEHDEQEIVPSTEEQDALCSKKMEKKSAVAYDDVTSLEDEIKHLTAENAELIEKMSDYITEKEKLQRECRELQANYDDALMKISELSFEVAKLKSSMNDIADNTNNSKTIAAPAKSINVRYSNHLNNGYTSWN